VFIGDSRSSLRLSQTALILDDQLFCPETAVLFVCLIQADPHLYNEPNVRISCGDRGARGTRARRKRSVAGVVSMLTLSKSRRIIDGAIQRARQLNAKISVAVCDRDGRLIAFGRMDGCAGWDVDRSSLGVATAAAITGCPSEQLSERYASGLRISSHANVVSPRGQRGGLPIVEEGVIEGGCGVSGAATAEESEECSRAGIAALNSARTEQALGEATTNPSMVSAPK
jgi:glc operon protein GlcG